MGDDMKHPFSIGEELKCFDPHNCMVTLNRNTIYTVVAQVNGHSGPLIRVVAGDKLIDCNLRVTRFRRLTPDEIDALETIDG